jgi:glutathione S-transferase
MTLTVYGMRSSGNCWKVEQILSLRRIHYDWIETDATAGATRTADFLKINPNGKVPAVKLVDSTILTESNAILTHFAEETSWMPPPGVARSRVMEWLFFEQYSHEPYVAVARNIMHLRGDADRQQERLAQCRAGGEHAFRVMSGRLATHPWLTDSGPTIADISLFAYSQVADQGGFDVAAFAGVASWVARFAALPGINPLR